MEERPDKPLRLGRSQPGDYTAEQVKLFRAQVDGGYYADKSDAEVRAAMAEHEAYVNMPGVQAAGAILRLLRPGFKN